MTTSVYKFIELVGTSTDPGRKPLRLLSTPLPRPVRDLRIAEVSELDVQLDDGKSSLPR